MAINAYSDCSDLPIHNFHKVLETGEHVYLLREGSVNDENREELKELWSAIYEEYCKLSEDNQSLMYFATASELLYLETRYQIAATLLQQLIATLEVKEITELYITELAKWNYRIDKSKPIQGELERMFRQLKQSQNKIKLKQNELEQYKDEDSEPMTLTQQVVKLEQALGRNEIDPKKTSVEKWVMLIKEVKEKNDSRKKVSNGRE